MMHVVLHQPQIPQNTGNIVRTCHATGSVLHLIEPMGFAWDDKKLKRAGLDYWTDMDIRRYADFDAFVLTMKKEARLWLLTTKAHRSYHVAEFRDGDYLMYGREDQGLPEALREQYAEHCLRVPMLAGVRSLNLANTVALTLYEALRQTGFAGLC